MGKSLYNAVMKLFKDHECENFVVLDKDPDSSDDSQHWGNDNWAEGSMLQALRQIRKNQGGYTNEPDDGDEDSERVNAKD